MHPRPAQDKIPIVWGGHSDAALRRVARKGDGWHPTQVPLDQLRDGVRRLREYCGRYGRDPNALLIVARPGSTYTITPETHAVHLEIGVHHLIMDTSLKDPSLKALHEEMDRIAKICGLHQRR